MNVPPIRILVNIGSDLTLLAVQMALRAALPSAEVLIDQRQQPGA
jgi:hypothetical protein